MEEKPRNGHAIPQKISAVAGHRIAVAATVFSPQFRSLPNEEQCSPVDAWLVRRNRPEQRLERQCVLWHVRWLCRAELWLCR